MYTCHVQVDFWGFGVIVFECISGKRPFLHGHPSAGFAWYATSTQCIHIEIHVHIHSTIAERSTCTCVCSMIGYVHYCTRS